MMKPKVTINETPAQQVIKASNSEHIVFDGLGRSIKLKKPGVLAQYRLIELLGDSAKNEVYTGMVLPLIFVCEIDGDHVYQPTSKKELEALIQRLDEDGITAISKGLEEHFSGNKTPAEAKESLKK